MSFILKKFFPSYTFWAAFPAISIFIVEYKTPRKQRGIVNKNKELSIGYTESFSKFSSV